LNWRTGVALSILAFIGGGIAISWLDNSGLAPWSQTAPEAPPAIVPPVAGALPTNGSARLIAPPTVPPVADSVRTEALLTVMAARRANAAGLALTDLKPRLQASFGQNQPQALAQLLAADREGVTSQALLRDFDLIAPSLLRDRQTTWQKVQAEAQTLFVLRRGDKVPEGPERNLARARDYLSSGNIEAAMRLVVSLPGANNASGWLEKAQAYREAQAALDALEQAALSMPALPLSATPAPAAPSAVQQADAAE
jgi:hypothetical protein